VLILPPKAANARDARGLQNGHHDRLTVDSTARHVCFPLGKIEQGLVIDRLDITQAQQTRRHAEGLSVLRSWNALLNLAIRGTIVDQRATTLRVHEHTMFQMSRPHFADLAAASGHRILVTIDAGGCIVERS